MLKTLFKLVAIIASLLVIGLVSCARNLKTEIEPIINKVYARNNSFSTDNLDTLILSKNTYKLIDKTNQITLIDIDRIKKSEYPTDKPLVLEGDLFSSLYEGHTSFTITSVKEENNKANVTLQFYNKDFKERWNDNLVLVNEHGWKIEDVIYHHPSASNTSLKKVLEDFIENSKQEN